MTRNLSNPVGTGALAILLAAGLYPLPGFGQQSVTLSFGWPADMHARVEYTATRSRSARGESHEVEMRGAYDVDTESVEDGLLVKISNLKVDLQGAAARDDPNARLQEFIAKAGSRVPDYVVDEKGRIVRVAGVEALQADLEAALGEILQGLPQQSRAPFQQMIRQSLTRERLEDSVREGWAQEVGSWIGATLEVGQPMEKEDSGKSALLGEVELPMKLTIEFLGRRPCQASAEEDSCVELQLRSSADSDAAIAAFESHLESLGRPREQLPRFESMTIEQRVVLLTEPDTLIPHSMQSERTTSLDFFAGGVYQSAEQSDRKTMVYQYRQQ